ncbi:MAG TPA: type VI secretion system protein TssA [Myxococcota bacterium]|nr:type VI secretion system protein TssA [Myxococcota bacterium]
MPELEALVLPIAGAAPAGPNLRLAPGDVVFERVQAGRSEVLPEVDPGGVGRAADWPAVARECEAALREKTKDLELAAWLAEAWARLHSFEGLRDGLRLVGSLCDSFWDGLHPGLDDGVLDLAVRARPLSWLGSSRNMLRTVNACALVPVPGKNPLSFEDLKLAQMFDEKALLPDKRQHQELVARGLFGTEEWRARLRAAPAEALTAVHNSVSECQAVLAGLREQIAKRFPEGDAPNLVPLAELLADVEAQLDMHVEKPAAAAAEATSEAAAAPASASAAAAPAPARGPIASRDEALRALSLAADYFRKHEPHSPIAALVARAVRWGSLPFEAVLREVVQDEGALARVWNTLGIENPGGAAPDAAKKR